MKTCENCIHWKELREDHNLLYLKWDDDFGFCELTNMQDGEPVFEGTKSTAYDAEEYHATLVCHKDFSCSQFEAIRKEKETNKKEDEEFLKTCNELDVLRKQCIDLVEDILTGNEVVTIKNYLIQGIKKDNSYYLSLFVKDTIKNLTQLKTELEKIKKNKEKNE